MCITFYGNRRFWSKSVQASETFTYDHIHPAHSAENSYKYISVLFCLLSVFFFFSCFCRFCFISLCLRAPNVRNKKKEKNTSTNPHTHTRHFGQMGDTINFLFHFILYKYVYNIVVVMCLCVWVRVCMTVFVRYVSIKSIWIKTSNAVFEKEQTRRGRRRKKRTNWKEGITVNWDTKRFHTGLSRISHKMYYRM